MPVRRRNPIRQMVAVYGSIGFLKLAAWLPLPLARALARVLARIAYYVIPRIRRVGLKNLDLAYGDELAPSEKRRILKGAVRHVGLVAAEFSRLPRFTRDETVLPLEIVDLERVRNLKGVLCIGAHLGNWELFAPALVRLGSRVAGVVRPLDNPALNAIVDAHRSAGGFTTLPKDNAGREMIRLLREGWHIGVLIDQSPRENGVPATFFGQPCWATIAPVMIGQRAKAPVIAGCVARQPDGTYRLELGEPIEMVHTGDIHADIVVNTQKCQDAIEALVRKYPDQWLWFHRRWKERPRLAREWEERKAKARARMAKRGNTAPDGVS